MLSQFAASSSVMMYEGVSNGVINRVVDTVAFFDQLFRLVSVNRLVAGAPLQDF
jgi:hypothetical protein